MKRMNSGILVLLSALFLISCSNQNALKFITALNTNTVSWKEGEKKATEVPFKYIDGRIIIPVSINNSDDLNFVLDTGASATVLIESHNSRKLSVVAKGQVVASGAGDGSGTQAGFIHGVDLGVGAMSLKDKSIFDFKLSNFPFFANLDEAFFDGIIGYDLFAYLVVEIDFEQSIIKLSAPEEFAVKKNNLLSEGWVEVPLQIRTLLPHISSKVTFTEQASPIDLTLLLDTGANAGLFVAPNSHDDIEYPDHSYGVKSVGVSGTSETRVGRVSAVEIAGTEFKEIIGVFAEIETVQSTGAHGLIGTDLLSKFNVIFNYQEGYMLIKPNHRFDKPIKADRGELGTSIHTKGYIVKAVSEEHAANDSGVQVGDIIVSFNNKKATPENREAFRDLLTSEVEKISLCWIAADTQRHCGEHKLMDRL